MLLENYEEIKFVKILIHKTLLQHSKVWQFTALVLLYRGDCSEFPKCDLEINQNKKIKTSSVWVVWLMGYLNS